MGIAGHLQILLFYDNNKKINDLILKACNFDISGISPGFVTRVPRTMMAALQGWPGRLPGTLHVDEGT
jgi:hypothetical protein